MLYAYADLLSSHSNMTYPFLYAAPNNFGGAGGLLSEVREEREEAVGTAYIISRLQTITANTKELIFLTCKNTRRLPPAPRHRFAHPNRRLSLL